jgi:hypothetical protein
MNGPTKTVGPPLTPLPARKSRGVLEKVLDNADAVIDGMYGPPQSCKRKRNEWQLVCAKCMRPLVESVTPGHDGYPLALVRIMWTDFKDLFR